MNDSSATQAGAGETYRPYVDGLRAVAILLVVGYHVGLPGFAGGFVGVDLFFVISGYLIIGNLHREALRTGTVALGVFAARRMRRLAPPALVMIVVVLGLGLVTLDPIDQRQALASSALATLALGANVYFWRVAPADYFDPATVQPLLHMWSLAVEEQFYLVAPLGLLLLTLATRRLRWNLQRTIVVVLVVGSMASLAFAVWTASLHPRTGFFLPVGRAYEFGIGGLLAVTGWALPRRARPFVLGAALACLVVVSVLPLPGNRFPGAWALLPVAAGAGLLVAGRGPGWVGATLGADALTWIGRRSYAWYLWHYPLLVLVDAWNLGPVGLPARLAVVLVALAAAAASYRLVEQPSRRLLPHAGRNQARRTVAVGVVSVLVTAGLALVYLQDAQREATQEPWTRIAAARDDLPVLPDGCSRQAAPVGVDPEPCLVVDAGSDRPVVVLWGDSHAWHLLPGLVIAAEQGDLDLVAWIAGGCPPYVAPTAPDDSDVPEGAVRQLAECDQHNRSALADVSALAGTGRETVVIASARWEQYVGVQPLSLVDRLPGGELRAIPEAKQGRVRDLFPELLDDLDGLDTPTAVVRSSPELARAAPACVLTPDRPYGCDGSRGELEDHRARSDELLASAAAPHPDVTLVDPLPWLCTGSTCPARTGDRIAYFDDDHLSATQSAALAPRWTGVLDDLLGSASP